MDKKNKIILIVSIIAIVGIIIYRLISHWMEEIMEGKPNGPYHSSESIAEAKKEKVWIATFLPTEDKYFSAERSSTYEIKEVWVETNTNDKNIYWQQAGFKSILNIYFQYLTKNNLHKFRLIPDTALGSSELEQVEHPDGNPRVRFLLNAIKDTIRLEVIERNPEDSLAWMTEEVIDTIVLIRKN